MKGLKKILAMVLSVAMVMTMVSFTALADEYTGTTTSQTTTTEATAPVQSDLGMYKVESATVSINEKALTAEVTFKTAPKNGRSYPKIALVEQTATDAEKEAAAIEGTVTKTENADGTFAYQNEYSFTIPVAQLGEKIPVSFYQTDDSDAAKNNLWYNWSSQHYLTVGYTADVVSALIDLIYVQTRDENTDMLCTKAKEGWDALSDEEQQQVDPYDYFGVDTGDGTKDNPRNQDDIGEKELLVVSFGTSFNGSRVATIGAIEDALEKAYPEYSVRRAFTAQIIINHIQAREGYKIDNVDEAIQRAIDNGVKELVVQPTHLMTGAEYDEMKEEIDAYADYFDSIRYSYPLCKTDADKSAVVDAVTKQAASDAGLSESALSEDNADTAFVFMGHGTAHEANETYALMQTVIDNKGLKNCFIGTVEGKPESTELSVVLGKIQAAGYKKVILRPLMVVAGDHANNDMAGDDADSWKSTFEAAGIDVETQINGLGEIASIRDMYVAHTQNAINSIVDEDGTYMVDIDTTAATMFNIAADDEGRGTLKVENGVYTLTMRLNGTGWTKLYVGSAEDAANADAADIYSYDDSTGYYSFTFPITSTGEIKLAAFAAKSQKWYDKTITLSAPYTIKSLQKEIKKQAAENEALKESNENTQSQLDEANSKLDEANSKLDDTNTKLDTANTKLATANTQVKSVKTQLANVKAQLAAAKTAYKNYVTIHTVKDNAVKNAKAKAGSKHYVTLTWKKNSKATSYIVYRSTKKSSGFKKVATVKKNKATIKGQKKGKTYYFYVKAAVKVSGKTYTGKKSATVKVKAK